MLLNMILIRKLIFHIGEIDGWMGNCTAWSID
jgi:hypothetical protein